jgi:hypothetical protein
VTSAPALVRRAGKNRAAAAAPPMAVTAKAIVSVRPIQLTAMAASSAPESVMAVVMVEYAALILPIR